MCQSPYSRRILLVDVPGLIVDEDRRTPDVTPAGTDADRRGSAVVVAAAFNDDATRSTRRVEPVVGKRAEFAVHEPYRSLVALVTEDTVRADVSVPGRVLDERPATVSAEVP